MEKEFKLSKKGFTHTFTAALHRFGDWLALGLSGCLVVKSQAFAGGEERVAWIALALGILISMLVFPSMSVYQRWRGETQGRELYTVSIAWSVVFVILASFLKNTYAPLVYRKGKSKGLTISPITKGVKIGSSGSPKSTVFG